jgi:hypothetical protein
LCDKLYSLYFPHFFWVHDMSWLRESVNMRHGVGRVPDEGDGDSDPGGGSHTHTLRGHSARGIGCQ